MSRKRALFDYLSDSVAIVRERIVENRVRAAYEAHMREKARLKLITAPPVAADAVSVHAPPPPPPLLSDSNPMLARYMIVFGVGARHRCARKRPSDGAVVPSEACKIVKSRRVARAQFQSPPPSPFRQDVRN